MTEAKERVRNNFGPEKKTITGMGRAGLRYLVATLVSLILSPVLFFISAGRLDLPRAWILFALTLLHYLVSTLWLWKTNPGLITHRGERKADAKSWDRILVPAYMIIGARIFFIVAGLDVGRFAWSNLKIEWALVGLGIYLLSSVLVTWAMIANRHFETFVRIQRDRDHQVITAGPYRLIRHPGYTAGILWNLSTPLILGSLYGFIPAGIALVLLIIRTRLEDRILHRELPGYAEYARQVKYKLFPGLW